MTVRLRLDARARRFQGGRILLGGAPLRLLRLGPAGVERVDAWLAGAPVGERPHEQALARRMLDAGIMHPIPVGGAPTRDDVTLVVPVKNNRVGLQRLLAATPDLRHRVVVDDGSSVPLSEATVRHRASRGPAAARNAGWRTARTPLIAFLDSDTIPDPGWLDAVLPLFGDSSVAAVAPRIRALPAGPVGRYEVHRSSLDMGPDPATVRHDGRVRYVPTAALVVRRSALESIDGFDESLRFGEDVDLVWRLLATGKTVRYQPFSIVRHEPRPTVRAWLRQQYDYGTSAAPLAARHPGRLGCAHLPKVFAAQCALVLTGHPAVAAAAGILDAGRSAHRLHRHGIPARAALGIAGTGQFALIRQAADALRRVWWPPALLSRRGRTVLAAALLSAAAADLARGRNPCPGIAADLAYGVGVWAGCLRHRTAEPLLPQRNRSRDVPH
ncbi:mycofactocin biosynthesis glycosyltransferase MftF [Nocardia sp. CA-107356]|uniref:mycofactocin biosynthesis glycosyltransferase MftF n=1 Tax=Nocardia sp. CA-107356 TaxID=3239972 RepID=UPI003D8F3566